MTLHWILVLPFVYSKYFESLMKTMHWIEALKQINETIYLKDKLAVKIICCYIDSLFQLTFNMLCYEYICAML